VLPLAAVTAFRARRVYAAYTTRVARAVLWLCGVRVGLHGVLPRHGRPPQVVYVSNHSSTIDLFVLVALGLPNTRFFLSGYLRKVVPLAILARLMGTFFTVPQDRTTDRRRIFARACRVLERTRESVYLSPEGGRVTTGGIGAFNKGAFHLAAALGAPIVPLYFLIPSHMDPGRGYGVRPGQVDVFVKPAIDTVDWRVDNLGWHKDAVRELFVVWHRDAGSCRAGAPPSAHSAAEALHA
jgi:1-acyl-sn-glycerol-3-phosphate acyltransferase